MSWDFTAARGRLHHLVRRRAFFFGALTTSNGSKISCSIPSAARSQSFLFWRELLVAKSLNGLKRVKNSKPLVCMIEARIRAAENPARWTYGTSLAPGVDQAFNIRECIGS